MEMDREFANKGVAGAGLGLGIAGTALGLLNGGIPGLLGGKASTGNDMALAAMMSNCAMGARTGCSEDHLVDRYSLAQEQRISELQSQLALRDSNLYQDQKTLELYKYIDGKIEGINAQLCSQAVINAQLTANISCMQGQIAVLNGLTKTVIPITNVCPQPAVATTTTAGA